MTMNKKPLKIIIDQDDVLALTTKEVVRRYNKEWDDDISIETFKGWNWHLWVKPECGRLIYDYLNQQEFFESLEPMPGAINGMKTLIEHGHDVVIGTSSPRIGSAYQGKLNWIKKHLPFFNTNNFAAIKRKDMLRGHVILDDAVHNLVGFKGTPVCMDKPWNRGEDFEHRVSSWAEFLPLVDQLAEKYYF